MSYEELLALEERIGSVSTALSQEQFAKCLRRSIYNPAAAEVEKSVVADLKCSICQEEYMEGEEVGRLPCEHQYHVCCIHQWLRQKNWCPVCKASAVPSME
uniref:RING-type E3 ubiquitin transferase n=1 Tax=Arundo donax TaxID=35708 RepID=A0A0A9EX84_ARUDO